jgi:hypothetical protein
VAQATIGTPATALEVISQTSRKLDPQRAAVRFVRSLLS